MPISLNFELRNGLNLGGFDNLSYLLRLIGVICKSSIFKFLKISSANSFLEAIPSFTMWKVPYACNSINFFIAMDNSNECVGELISSHTNSIDLFFFTFSRMICRKLLLHLL